MSKVTIVLFQGTIPMPLTRHTSIIFLPETVMVLGLLLVTCSLRSWTGHPDCLVICRYTANRRAVFLSLCYGKHNALPTGIPVALRVCLNSKPPILRRRCEKCCFVSWWETNEFIPGGLTSDSQFVNSLLSSQGEKPSPDLAGKTGSRSVGKWVLIHWATVSGSYPKLLAFIRRLQIWRITSNWKLMHIFFLKGSP